MIYKLINYIEKYSFVISFDTKGKGMSLISSITIRKGATNQI